MRPPTCLATEYDAIVTLVYRAAAGIEPWVVPLNRIAQASAASSVNLGAFNKRTDAVLFSYTGGPRHPKAATDYIRKYRRIDPRLALVKTWPVGRWLACQEHFDDDYVARDPFYQKYLLPYGSRYVYGAKVWEDAETMIVFAHHRPPGKPLVDADERGALHRLGTHIAHALEIQRQQCTAVDRDALGYALLDRLRHPVILLDRDRNITFSSDAAKAILARGDVLRDHQGILVCRNADSDTALTLALRELELVPSNSHVLGKAPEERKTLRLQCADGSRTVIATVFALRPTAATERFGPRSRALLTLIEPGLAKVEPSLLASAFGFTPAEARVAARLASGLSVEEIASEGRISVTTVRSQLKALFEKSGTNRQADLVRLLLAVTTM